jgi:dihydrofolate reductase
MRKLSVFNHVSLDGYFTDENSDMSWAHTNSDPEWDAFTAENAKRGGELLFGRKTYDMMASYWPTPAAMKQAPDVAEGMNNLPKVVFSRTMDKAAWKNTKLIKTDPAEAVRQMKKEAGKPMMIMGSGTIVSQLAQAGLIDEFQIVVNPIVLGKGRTLFETVSEKLPLRETSSRTFKNGSVLVCYEPKR